jgi:hypothetical protein
MLALCAIIIKRGGFTINVGNPLSSAFIMNLRCLRRLCWHSLVSVVYSLKSFAQKPEQKEVKFGVCMIMYWQK